MGVLQVRRCVELPDCQGGLLQAEVEARGAPAYDHNGNDHDNARLRANQGESEMGRCGQVCQRQPAIYDPLWHQRLQLRHNGHGLGARGGEFVHEWSVTVSGELRESMQKAFDRATEKSREEEYVVSLPAGQIWKWTYYFDDSCGKGSTMVEALVSTKNLAQKPCCLPGHAADPK